MLNDLPINILQERIMESEPGSEEAKHLCLELARRFQEGDGVEIDLEEAQYWLSQAGQDIPQEPQEEAQQPAEKAAPIDIGSYLAMTPFRRRRAYQAREPGGMYSYALYLDQNEERSEALAILQELVGILEQPHWVGVGDTLLAMAKVKLGQFYADPLFDDMDEERARMCLEEAALELGYLEAFPELIELYDETDELDDHTERLLAKLSRVKPKDAKDLLTLAEIYQRLDRKAYAAACCQGVLAQEEALETQIREAQAELENLDVPEWDLWNLWRQAMTDDPEAVFRFARAAEAISDYETHLELLLRYMELEADGDAPDDNITAQVCGQLALYCGEQEALEYARKGAQLGDQSCRWLLYTLYASPESLCYDTVKASGMLDDFGEHGTTADKLKVAEQFEEMQRPARAKIWYQEVLAQRDDPCAISHAYHRLCVLKGTDEEDRPITRDYLAQRAGQGDQPATLALVRVLLSVKLPLMDEIDMAQNWLDRLDGATDDAEWNNHVQQCITWIADLRTQRRLQDEQAERDRLAALAQQELQRRAQEEKEEKARVAEQKRQERLEKQRASREAAKLAKQRQAEDAARQAHLKAQQEQFLQERQELRNKRDRYRREQSGADTMAQRKRYRG